MDKDTAAEMIQAKALGSLDSNEHKELNEFLNMGGVFPWKEFGEIQNLCSLLPIILEIEVPDTVLKDKVAKRIYDAIAEQKEKMSLGKGIDQSDSDIIYPETTIMGDQVFPVDPKEEESLADVFEEVTQPEVIDSTSEEIPLDVQSDSTEEPPISGTGFEIKSPEVDELTVPEPPVSEEKAQTDVIHDEENMDLDLADLGIQLEEDEKIDTVVEPSATIPEKKVEHKPETKKIPPVKPDIQSKFRQMLEEKAKRKAIVEEIPLKREKFIEPEKPKKKSSLGLIIDIVLYILLLAAITFVYIKLSSDIDELKKEVKDLKKEQGSLLLKDIGDMGFQV